MSYIGEAPHGASQFEAVLGLSPLGPEVTPARLARLEEIATLFVSAAVDPSSARARVWVGSFAPSQVEVPVPAEAALEGALNNHRAPEEIAARRAQEAYLRDMDNQ